MRVNRGCSHGWVFNGIPKPGHRVPALGDACGRAVARAAHPHLSPSRSQRVSSAGQRHF